LLRNLTQTQSFDVVGPGISSQRPERNLVLLDSQVGMPINPKVNSDQMAESNLFDYNTLILPSENYRGFLRSNGAHLKDLANRGGRSFSMKTASLLLNRIELTKEGPSVLEEK